MKEYRYLRIILAFKKIGTYVILIFVVYLSLILYNKNYHISIVILYVIIFAYWLYKHMKIYDFFQPDWDGEVVEKVAWLSVKPKAMLNSALPQAKPSYKCCLVVRRNSDGKLFKTIYNEYCEDGFSTNVKYFRHGETVRHHRCLPLYEKFDKSKERKLLCFKCGRFVDKYEEKCWHCGLPVLSEETEYVKKTHTLHEGEKRSDRTW